MVVVVVPADFLVFVSQDFKVTIVVACNDEVVVPDTGKGVATVVALGTLTVTSVLGFVDDNPGDVVPTLEAVVSFVFSGKLEFDIVIDLVVPGDFEVTSDEEVVDFVVVPSVTVVVAFVVCSDVNTGDSVSSSVIVGVFVTCGDTYILDAFKVAAVVVFPNNIEVIVAVVFVIPGDLKIVGAVVASGDLIVVVLDVVKLVDSVSLDGTVLVVVPGDFEYVVGVCELELFCIISDDLAVVAVLPGNLLVVIIPCSFFVVVVVDGDLTVIIVVCDILVVVAVDSATVTIVSGILEVAFSSNNFAVDGGFTFVDDFPNDTDVSVDTVSGDLAVVAVVLDKLKVSDVLDAVVVGGGGSVVLIADVPTALVAIAVSSDAVETVPASYINQKCLVICTNIW